MARETVNDSGDQVEWTEDQSGVRSEIPSWGNGMCERTESGQFPNSTGKGGRLLPGTLSALTGSEPEERKREEPATFPNRGGRALPSCRSARSPFQALPPFALTTGDAWSGIRLLATLPPRATAEPECDHRLPCAGAGALSDAPGRLGPLGFRQPQ